jgi:site-specific recombinase XerD
MLAPWNKGRRLPPEVLTLDELRALLRAPSGRAPTGVRNRAVLAVMWGAGLRVGEAVALMPKDYDAEAGTLRVLHGKGDKARTVALVAGQDALERWLDRRAKLGLTARHPLFSTLAGTALSTDYVRQMTRRMAKRAGIERRVSPHTLRHTHAYGLVQDGEPVTAIQGQLGHANVAVTARYVAHLHPRERVERLRRLDWDARLTPAREDHS